MGLTCQSILSKRGFVKHDSDIGTVSLRADRAKEGLASACPSYWQVHLPQINKNTFAVGDGWDSLLKIPNNPD